MIVYTPIVKGVYRHAVLGVFTDLDKAVQVGTDFITKEADHYHSVEIVQFVLDNGEIEEKSIQTLVWMPDSWNPNDKTGPGKVVEEGGPEWKEWARQGYRPRRFPKP